MYSGKMSTRTIATALNLRLAIVVMAVDSYFAHRVRSPPPARVAAEALEEDDDDMEQRVMLHYVYLIFPN